MSVIRYKKEDLEFLEEGVVPANGQEKKLEDIKIRKEGIPVYIEVTLEEIGSLRTNYKKEDRKKVVFIKELERSSKYITSSIIDNMYSILDKEYGLNEDKYEKIEKITFVESEKKEDKLILRYYVLLENGIL